MVDIASFHFQFVEFSRRFVVCIGIVPILDEILFEFLPHVHMGGSWYWPPHNPIFYAAFPFGNGSSLYEGKGVCDLSVGVGHDWGVRVKELVKFEFVHELVGSGSIT
jgi:hypothetical protein